MFWIKATKTHWIITWRLEESENYDRFGMEGGRGWMAQLAPVRDELLRGDIRGLYIGWLAAVTGGRIDDDEMEPQCVSGLGNLKKLSKDFPKVWKTVQRTVERGSGLAYDEACCTLIDLSEAYSLYTSRKRFQQELSKFMAGHMRRKALLQRLVKAGIWGKSL